MPYRTLLIILFLYLLQIGYKYSYGQTNIKADSLFHQLTVQKEDTLKLNTLFELFRTYYFSQSDSALDFAKQGLELSYKLNQKSDIALFHNACGQYYIQKGNYAYALEHHLNALRLRETINNKKDIASSLNNIGLVYNGIGDYDNCLKYFTKALEINQQIQNNEGIAHNSNNLSIVYSRKKKYDAAILYGKNALEIWKEINNSSFIAATLNNLGNCYQEKKEYTTAINYYRQALEISKQINDNNGIAIRLQNIGTIYKEKQQLDSAHYYFTQSLQIAKDINNQEIMSANHLALSDLYAHRGQYKNAYEHHLLFYSLTDSLLNDKITEQISEMSAKYETEKKQKEIELLNKESEKQIAISTKEKEKQKIIIYSVSTVLLLLLVLVAFIYRGYFQKKKLSLNLAHKNQEITDNINYANRLQKAILPPNNYWKKYLPQSFVLYLPKDIVSGDFYWLENINDSVLFASADCTGHGVSGAMVSVVCSNALNQTVKEFSITEPAKILDKTRELVLETFEKSDEDVKDGMDISLCCLNTKTNELLWAGANNPLWYIRANNIYEIKGDKQPIGKNDNPKPFTTHKIKLEPGDTIYVFTDGYADQFGGKKGKKFMYKPLKELLLSIQSKSINEQQEILHQNFINWKDNTEQTDDVLVIGLKII